MLVCKMIQNHNIIILAREFRPYDGLFYFGDYPHTTDCFIFWGSVH